MKAALLILSLYAASLHAAEPCRTFHGRAHYYGGDGNLWIWHIGAHHRFSADLESWDRVMGWLRDGVPKAGDADAASPESSVYLYGDFKVCPVEPLRPGWAQKARIESVSQRHYTHA
jgi:hypothetical protein